MIKKNGDITHTFKGSWKIKVVSVENDYVTLEVTFVDKEGKLIYSFEEKIVSVGSYLNISGQKLKITLRQI